VGARKAALADLHALLGGDPGAAGLRGVTRIAARDHEGWVLEDLRLETGGAEPVPAWFLRPPEGAAPVPAVLYCPAHGNNYPVGRDELIVGRPALIAPYADDLIGLGCAALCLEMPCFGLRQDPGEDVRAKAHLWAGTNLFGQMLAELSAGLDLLSGHRAVARDRIGTLGLSMGGTHAWWLAALDRRVRAASALCCMADLDALISGGGHDLHGIYMMVPGLAARHRTGRIAGLTAPRALQIAVGLADPLTPPGAFAVARRDLEHAFTMAPNRLSFHVEPGLGHQETPAMRRAVLAFLHRELGSDQS